MYGQATILVGLLLGLRIRVWVRVRVSGVIWSL